MTAFPAETARLRDAMASFWEAVLALGLPEAHLPDLQRSFRASLDAGIKLIGAMTRPAADELCERLEQTARDIRAGR